LHPEFKDSEKLLEDEIQDGFNPTPKNEGYPKKRNLNNEDQFEEGSKDSKPLELTKEWDSLDKFEEIEPKSFYDKMLIGFH